MSKFKIGKFKQIGVRDVQAAMIDVKGSMKHEDLYEYAEKIRKQLLQKLPDAEMSIGIKYASMSTPISSGFFSVKGKSDIRTPYDYQDEEEEIETLWVQVRKI